MAITSVKNILARTINLASPNGSTSVYATASDLPLTNNTVGAHAFVQATNRLYVWNGSGWYSIALVNRTPTITVGADASYTLVTDGTPLEIALTAVDPEGFPITWSYELTSGTLGNTTVTANANVFTITPSAVASDAGTFSLTFKASDGVNIAADTASFTVENPVLGTDAGWYGGGAPSATRSTVDRLVYASDTSVLARGPLSIARSHFGATGNANYGWFGGGQTPGTWSVIDRVDYGDDTSVALVRSALTGYNRLGTATGNTNYGWWALGEVSIIVSTIDRLTYSSDTSNAISRGPLSYTRYRVSATGNTSYGWFSGGASPATQSIIDRITYSSDTSVMSVRGPMGGYVSSTAATGNANYGWINGNYPGKSTVYRIDYAADTNTALLRGPTTVSLSYRGATSNDNYGWFAGGYPYASTIDRIDYADDTVIATYRGKLSTDANAPGATGGYPG